jgi:hypothetical protein
MEAIVSLISYARRCCDIGFAAGWNFAVVTDKFNTEKNHRTHINNKFFKGV